MKTEMIWGIVDSPCGKCGRLVPLPTGDEVAGQLGQGKSWALVRGVLFLRNDDGGVVCFMVRCMDCLRPGSPVYLRSIPDANAPEEIEAE